MKSIKVCYTCDFCNNTSTEGKETIIPREWSEVSVGLVAKKHLCADCTFHVTSQQEVRKQMKAEEKARESKSNKI